MDPLVDRLKQRAWRLRAMHLAELPHRAREVVRRARDRRGVPAVDLPAPLRGTPAPGWPVDLALLEAAVDLEALRLDTARILTGAFPLLGVERPAGTRTAWWLAPEDGSEWPRSGFAKGLDVLFGSPGNEIKLPWVLARLQHLQLLALAGALLGDDEARTAALADLERFIDDNPPYQGIHWYAGIETAHRIASMLVVIGLAGPLDAPLADKLWASLRAHGQWIRRYPSLYSSANNHLVAEIAGLYALATLGADLPEAPEWRAWAGALLAQEAARQIHPDGVGAEQSPAYQAFTMEWLLLARQVGLATGHPLDDVVDGRLRTGARFLRTTMDEGGHHPDMGDNDDGTVLTTGLGHASHVASVCGAVAQLLGLAEVAPPGWRTDSRAALLGAPPLAPAAPPPQPSSCHFRDGGYTVLRSARWVATLDHAPLGFMATAAHGHADALSLWASLDGQPLLVDTGTLGYNGVPRWRTWVRSTPAHNTITVDGADQSAMTGRFTWGRRARAEVVDLDLDAGTVSARHDGYARLGVTHRRSLALDQSRLTVTDHLEGHGEHEVQVCWHLAPGLAVRADAHRVVLARDGVEVAVLRVQGPELALSVHEQAEEPGPGWVSPSWNVRVAAPCLVLSGRVRLPARWTWTLAGA